jgi:antitoxin (DNA-binding transcriptional repressor) of toxin-antitoxin stability system
MPGPTSSLLPAAPTAREARDRISAYVDLALRGESTKIVSRGKHVATIAPLPSRRGVSALPMIATSELKSGRRTLMSLLSHGPQIVLTRNKRPVALLSVSKPAARRVATKLGSDSVEAGSRVLDRLRAVEAKVDALPAKILEVTEAQLLAKRAELAALEERRREIVAHQRRLVEIWRERVELARRLPGPAQELADLCESWEGTVAPEPAALSSWTSRFPNGL